MEKKSEKPRKKPLIVKEPDIHPDAIPDEPVLPVEETDAVPDEDPYDPELPYEKPEPGEGP